MKRREVVTVASIYEEVAKLNHTEPGRRLGLERLLEERFGPLLAAGVVLAQMSKRRVDSMTTRELDAARLILSARDNT